MSTTTDIARKAAGERGTVWKTIHRVIFPDAEDVDTMPLYVDFNNAQRIPEQRAGAETVTATATGGATSHPDYVVDRRSLSLPAHERVSLGTYFNAFPASYWQAHTEVRTVRLTVDLDGDATVVVYRSTSRGTANRVSSTRTGSAAAPVVVELPIASFGDGGWYWFDLAAHNGDVLLRSAEWSVPEPDGFVPGRLSIAVTTFNRPDYCVRNLGSLGQSDDLLDVLQQVIVTDQGTQKVRDEPGIQEAAAALGGRLSLVEQANLGGSGGFARGMLEAVEDERSTYVMLLDDDVEMETEGILRAAQFADFTRKPTIVGGHMFNLFERSVMHNFGEAVQQYRFSYGGAENTQEAHDFASSNLRTTPWMHRRVDVDYNGWWMCLIPTEIIRQIGLALPVFIKWDDVEYGIRAASHGFTTVTLPGSAVWHMPWTEKDDTIDWQAYYHQRNRWVATLLYSPYKRGGRMPKESIGVDARHLLSMQYSAVELRLQALEDVLSGPDHLHRTIGSKLGEVRATRAQFDDARVSEDLVDFPAVKRVKPPHKGKAPAPARSRPAALAKVFTGALHQLKPVPQAAITNPEAHVAAVDARWWRLSQLDSALVTSSDGTGASWHKRDVEKARELALRSADLHRRLYQNWNQLAEQYQAALPEFTSQAAWKRTFAQNGPETPPATGKKE
ncbi:glycosyltransferase [Arthrobacter agilis]|uniref:glycosyltransferase n=1 Tax=Arthrobacter agilis TaxID=37921 RepID=UPI002366E912|nr:glycosyltransferase [Arthrobacter agilis]WDF32402.1 glycosyltransferase [Arthrobacter agilis]